ncbi:MAG: OB-fold nucleic acid binding domain-containing protein [Propionibacteriaceae bacterium]|jgi:hypothetical protein|nr:OB-fold nucleic acid binding domain-containing protein [Propionibacteriaceae bacterium]
MSRSGRPSLWRRLVGLFATDEPVEPIDLDPVPTGPQPIASVQARRRLDSRGQISATQVVAHPSGPWFEATLTDGSGAVTLVWMGRADVPGVTPGRHLRVRGRLAPDRGRLVVFNPDYTLEPTADNQSVGDQA